MDAYMELTRMFQDQLKKKYELERLILYTSQSILEIAWDTEYIPEDVKQQLINLADFIVEKARELR